MNKGFTLLELLIVIAIIGLLATIVLVNINSSRSKAQYAATSAEINQLIKIISIVQGETGELLLDITEEPANGTIFPWCVSGGPDVRGDTGQCFTDWQTSLNNIIAASNGLVQITDGFDRDAWESPYGLDEQEGDLGECLRDRLLSAGPDGIFFNSDDIDITLPASGYCCSKYPAALQC